MFQPHFPQLACKKVVSDSGVVDFGVRLIVSILHLPDGKVNDNFWWDAEVQYM